MSSNQNFFGFPYLSPPPPHYFPFPPKITPPPFPPSWTVTPPPKPPTPAKSTPPPKPPTPVVAAPPPPPRHAVPPPSPIVKPPPRPIAPPPPHIVPPSPAPSNHTTIIIVFVSLGGLFFLAFLSVALCCFIKKKKEKKMVQKAEIINIDEHMKVHETIVPGPHGTQSVVLSIEEDVHIQEVIKMNERVGKGLHTKSLESNEGLHGTQSAESASRSLDVGASTSGSSKQLHDNKP